MIGDGALVVDGGLMSFDGACDGVSDSAACPIGADLSFREVMDEPVSAASSSNTLHDLFLFLGQKTTASGFSKAVIVITTLAMIPVSGVATSNCH